MRNIVSCLDTQGLHVASEVHCYQGSLEQLSVLDRVAPCFGLPGSEHAETELGEERPALWGLEGRVHANFDGVGQYFPFASQPNQEGAGSSGELEARVGD